MSPLTACDSDTKAYKYEKMGLPRKGAYIMIPKFRPRFFIPQMEDMILGLIMFRKGAYCKRRDSLTER